MARTARKKLSIYDHGILLTDDASSLDFTGDGVIGSVDFQGNVTENIPGSGPAASLVFGEIVLGLGTSFTLTHVPVGTISLAANGQVLTHIIDYTITGAVITTTSSWPTGSVLADYQY